MAMVREPKNIQWWWSPQKPLEICNGLFKTIEIYNYCKNKCWETFSLMYCVIFTLAGQISGQVSVCRAWNALPNNVEHKVEAIVEPFRSPYYIIYYISYLSCFFFSELNFDFGMVTLYIYFPHSWGIKIPQSTEAFWPSVRRIWSTM